MTVNIHRGHRIISRRATFNVSVAHDAFRRQSLGRACVGAGTCDWCGQLRRNLFAYRVEGDDGFVPLLGQPVGAENKAFCNLDCFKSYSS